MANPEIMRVKADNDLGFMIINKSDFNPEIHKPFDAPEKSVEAPEKEAPKVPKKKGRK